MPWSPYSEARELPSVAKQIRLMCPHCKRSVFVDLPTTPGITWNRQAEIRKAIDEHRRVCTVGDMTDGFVYDISYPRA